MGGHALQVMEAQGPGFRAQGSGFRAQGSGLQGSLLRVQGPGFMAQFATSIVGSPKEGRVSGLTIQVFLHGRFSGGEASAI